MICILLVLQAIVSYRSVPRILNIINTQSPLKLPWIPHFTSVINWTLRLGLGLLQEVKPLAKKWIAILDHSIDIGTKKAFVVLRIEANALSERKRAITLADCECIGLTVSEKVTGEHIERELTTIFKQAGIPDAIIKDKDATLNKGVRLWEEKQINDIPIIDDIGHVTANALKDQFENTKGYQRFKDLTNKGAARLRQTDMAFLIPPKLRTKGRFQSIGKLGKWGEKVLNIFTVKGRARKKSLLDRFRIAFPHLSALRPFIESFSQTLIITSKIMALLKNKGLTQEHYEKCVLMVETLPKRSKVRKHLTQWLDKHIKIQQKLSFSTLLVSSDIIESLFGQFKHVIERSPQADMNRTVLLIPALCGKIDGETIRRVFDQTSHAELKKWEDKEIPYTVRKKRRDFFKQNEAKKREKVL
jgi:hypothetical protein